MDIDLARKIKEDYINEFLLIPDPEYVQSVGDVKTIRALLDNNEKYPLKESDSLDDFCLVAFLKKEDTRGILPNTYKGLRVFYEFSEAVLLEDSD